MHSAPAPQWITGIFEISGSCGWRAVKAQRAAIVEQST